MQQISLRHKWAWFSERSRPFPTEHFIMFCNSKMGRRAGCPHPAGEKPCHLLQTLQAIRRDRCSPSARKGECNHRSGVGTGGELCHDSTYRAVSGYITPSYTTHPRAHNVCPYGLYRDKTQFSAPDYILRQYRIILSADTASEVRQMLSQKRR